MFRFFINANKCLKNFGDKELYREFNILRTKIVREYKDGFYTHGPKAKELINEESKISSLRGLAKYIARYASHPPLAESIF